MGAISALQQEVQSLQAELEAVRAEILQYKYRETSNINIVPSSNSNLALLSSGAVSIAALPPTPPPPQPPGPPPPSLPHAPSSSSMYSPPSTATDFSTISNENISYFG